MQRTIPKGVSVIRKAFDSVHASRRAELDPPQLRSTDGGLFSDMRYADVKYFDRWGLVYGEAEYIVDRSDHMDAVILAVPPWKGSMESNARTVTASPEIHGIAGFMNCFAVIGGQHIPGSIDFNVNHELGRDLSAVARRNGSRLVESGREDHVYLKTGAEDEFSVILARAIEEAVQK